MTKKALNGADVGAGFVQVVAGDPTGARVWGLTVIWWDALFGFSDSVLSDSWAVCGGGNFMAKIENARSKTKLPR